MSDSSEETQEGKNVDYGSLLVWLAIARSASKDSVRLQEAEFARR
jgi:hypothetical protein